MNIEKPKLMAYIAYIPEFYSDVVYAGSEEEAKSTAMLCGPQIRTEKDSADEIRVERLPDGDQYIQEGREHAYAETDNSILRYLGWNSEYSGDPCSGCGLYNYDSMHPICCDCEMCTECGCECDIEEGD